MTTAAEIFSGDVNSSQSSFSFPLSIESIVFEVTKDERIYVTRFTFINIR